MQYSHFPLNSRDVNRKKFDFHSPLKNSDLAERKETQRSATNWQQPTLGTPAHHTGSSHLDY